MVPWFAETARPLPPVRGFPARGGPIRRSDSSRRVGGPSAVPVGCRRRPVRATPRGLPSSGEIPCPPCRGLRPRRGLPVSPKRPVPVAFPYPYTVGPRIDTVTRLNSFTLAGYGLVVALSTLRGVPHDTPRKTRFAVGGYSFGGRNCTGWLLPACLGAQGTGDKGAARLCEPAVLHCAPLYMDSIA